MTEASDYPMFGNEWFNKYWAAKVTPEFRNWWISDYGASDRFDINESEQNEYWVRCAFALRGWLAASKMNVQDPRKE